MSHGYGCTQIKLWYTEGTCTCIFFGQAVLCMYCIILFVFNNLWWELFKNMYLYTLILRLRYSENCSVLRRCGKLTHFSYIKNNSCESDYATGWCLYKDMTSTLYFVPPFFSTTVLFARMRYWSCSRRFPRPRGVGWTSGSSKQGANLQRLGLESTEIFLNWIRKKAILYDMFNYIVPFEFCNQAKLTSI